MLRDSQLKVLDAETIGKLQVLEIEMQDMVKHAQGGAALLARRMGYTSQEGLSNEVCPTNRLSKFGALDFFLAVMQTRNTRVLDVFDAMIDRNQVGIASVGSLHSAIGQLTKELSDVVTVVIEASDDGDISPNESKQINKELDDLSNVIKAIRAHVNGG
jgi:hypothetical protein